MNMVPGIAAASMLFLSSAIGEGLPAYSPKTMTFTFDQSKGYGTDYEIPEKEKSFTKDLRKIVLPATVYPKGARPVVKPARYPKPKTPYEALANFLQVVKTKDIAAIKSLYDSSSQSIVDSAFRSSKDSAMFFEGNLFIEKIELALAMQADGTYIVYGNLIYPDKQGLFPWFLTKEKGAFKFKAGLIEWKFLNMVGMALYKNDQSVLGP